ncbi:MAG: Fe2+-dependent dioxygenase [Acidiferrobacterales bacterium]
MLVEIKNLLTKEQIKNIQQHLGKGDFVDGRLSAGSAATRVKNNLELTQNGQLIEYLNNMVMGTLVANPVYQAAVMPFRVASAIYARYQPGMHYGDHVDDPIMGAPGSMPGAGLYRTDVSTTVFLNSAEDYEGGELVINTSYGEHRVKLNAGDAVTYPASSLHHVSEVTSGERLVAVTWAQSMIREPARRELLYTLYQAKESLLAQRPNDRETAQVNTAYVNLVRMWSEL